MQNRTRTGQGRQPVNDITIQTEVTSEINRAILLTEINGHNMTVVKTSSGIEVFTDTQLELAKEFILQAIFSTKCGLIQQ